MVSGSKWRTTALLLSLLGVVIVGYFDYRSGFENTMVLFYLGPIAAATWWCGLLCGIGISLCSIVAWVSSDIAAGIPEVRAWNIGTSFVAYLVFVILFSALQRALAQTQERVEQRTAELQRELGERKRLEQEIAAAAEHERQRVARELHDNLSQHLTGTSFFAKGVADRAAVSDSRMAADARKVVDLINRAIGLSRDVARGLFSFELDSNGLVSALQSLASSASQQHGIECSVDQADEVQLPKAVAGNLYWIANEAVSNAGKHGRAHHISIKLVQHNSHVRLEIADDGIGLPRESDTTPGIGLRVMQQRAQLAGASFRLTSPEGGGTKVTCDVPINDSSSSSNDHEARQNIPHR